MRFILTAAAIVLFAAIVSAQTVTNPTIVEFESPDHALIDSYELDLKLCVTGNICTNVLQTLTISKASVTPITGTNPQQYRATINVQPISFGTYAGAMRAVAGAVKSTNSPDSNTFVRAPGSPSKPTFK